METPSAGYLQRTEWNVRDTGGTVIFSLGRVLTGGSFKPHLSDSWRVMQSDALKLDLSK